MLEEYLNRDVPATGGLLFIVTSMFLAVSLVFGTTLAKETTSRSVAKSVEQQIAIQCLASCYINNEDPFEIRDGNRTFKKLGANGTEIDPLAQFNTAMHGYNLMAPQSNATDIAMGYTRGKTSKSTTFTLQCGEYKLYGTDSATLFRDTTMYPDPVKTVIEDK